jgi:hypothetical protein
MEEGRTPRCEWCGCDVDALSFSPTKVSRVTHQIRYGQWLCNDCLAAEAKNASRNLGETKGLKEPSKSLGNFFADFFRWLDHKTLELRIIDTVNGRVVFQDYSVTDPEFFAEKCLKYNGKHQVYYSAQARDGKGGTYENVPALTFIPVDVDAVRPNKKTEPANASQRFNAKRNMARILKFLGSKGIKPSLVVDTGNGFLILIRIPSQDTSPHFYKTGNSTQNKLSDMVNWFLQHEIKLLCDDTVEVDSVGDLPRILGVPGTVNIKSPKDEPRIRTIILGDISKPPEPQPALWRLIEDCWKRRETKDVTTVGTMTRDVDVLMEMLPPSLREGYEKPGVGERSDVLVRTLLHLANRHGLSKDECVATMELLTRKIGREKWPAAQQYDKLLADGKIKPSTFSLGEFTVRVKRNLALVYRGDEPIYPIEIHKLKSVAARKSLAKSLGVDENLVHPVAAKLLEMELTKPEEPKEPEEKKPTQIETEKKAAEILATQDPIEFISNVVQQIHYGDREKSKLVWLGSTSPGLGFELNLVVVGTSGIGKSDLIYAVLCAIPDEYVVRLKECSPKAIYYAAKAGVQLDKAVVYFDDVPDSPEVVKLLKDITGENRYDPRLWSVTADREFLDVELKGDFVVFASAIETLTDRGDQIVRRYLVLNPDENPEVNRKVMEKIKEDMRLGRGKRWLPSDFDVAKEITRQIKEADFQVAVPFDFDYPDYGPLTRSELKQFAALIWAVAKARFKQRLSLGKLLFAQIEDFEEAVKLWRLRQPGKVDETAIKILEELGDQEPKEDYDEKGKVIGFIPTPITSTIIAKKLKMKPQRVREKLEHLYNMGYVDRKAVSGRGNPYAYWKSQAYFAISETAKSLSPIHLKEPQTEALDYFGRIREQYAQTEEWKKVKDEYLKRTLDCASLLRVKSPEIIVKPEFQPLAEKQPDDLAKSEMAKSLGSVGTGIAGETNPWEGFGAVGYMATPDKNWRKTIEAVEQVKRLENREPTEAELTEALKQFWAPQSIPKVLDKLRREGIWSSKQREPVEAEKRKIQKSVTSVTSPVYLYRHVKPAGPCELCGQFPVEWEIRLPQGNMIRRCHRCFVKLRENAPNAVWKEMELG